MSYSRVVTSVGSCFTEAGFALRLRVRPEPSSPQAATRYPRANTFIAPTTSAFSSCPQSTHKLGLGLPILCGNVATGQTSLAGVVRRYGNEYSASPVEFVFQLAAKLEPALIEDGFVQPRLLS